MTSAPLVILAMLAAMALVGAWHARQVRSAEDFALAGRGLGTGVLIGTLVATWVGTGSILGNAEFTYMHGVAGFFLPLSGLVGMLVLVRIAPRVRALDASSVPEMLGLAFGVGARRLGAVALIGAYLIIVSYQYRAGAAVAERLFGSLTLGFPGGAAVYSGWPVICAVFVILYTALAGLRSVASTDTVAGVVIVLGVLSSLVLLGGEWNLESQPLPTTHLRPSGGLGPVSWIGLTLPPLLLMLGDANLMQRFLAAKSPRTARRAAFGAFLGLAVIESAVIALALVGRARLGPELDNPAHVILAVAFELVPPVLGLALIAAIVAVVLSTADSFLLAASTSAGGDLTGRRLEARGQRWLVVLLGLVALGLAFTSDSFFRVALFAYTIYGVAITPAVGLALFAPRTPAPAVVLGMLTGLVTALWWQLAGTTFDPVLPALGANLLVVLLVGSFLRRRAGPAAKEAS